MPSIHETIRTVPPERRRVDAVLLDLDGTLVDSNDAHARAWVDAIREAGYDVPFARIRPLIGMGSGPLLSELLGIPSDDPWIDELDQLRGRILRERYLGTITAQPGARELVEKLVSRGFAVVLATSASEEDVIALLQQTGLDEVVPMWTTADEVRTAKPAPDVVYAALEKTGATHLHAILVGDTPYDIEAARKAGVAVITLRCGGWDDDALDGAIEVFDDPSDLLRNWMQTPFRKSLADLDAPL